MKTCAVDLRTYFSDETSSCALIHMHHDSPCISDVLQRIKILLFLWQTRMVYKKVYRLNRMEPPHIYIFSHLANALEGQHSVFENWKCSRTLAVKDKDNFRPGWVINGTNVSAIQMPSADSSFVKTTYGSGNVAVLRSALTNLWAQPSRQQI